MRHLPKDCRLTVAFQAVFALTFLSISALSAGHSHLANPLPTRRLDCRVGNGRHRDCHGPCPPLDTYGDPTGISPSKPAESWRRGERRTISWHRNNHGKSESGFVRLTLVPVDKMMDRGAHEKFTIQVSCWGSGLHTCSSRAENVCGNDADAKAYKVSVTVPSAYPDGVYVFGWAWFGGGDFREQSFFGDYYSCSFVRIEGGAALTAESKPVFYAGENTEHNDGCLSSTSSVGQCPREPCLGKPITNKVPTKIPRSISSKELSGLASNVDSQPKFDSPQAPLQIQQSQSEEGPVNIKGLQVIDISSGEVESIRGSTVKLRLSRYEQGFTFSLKVSGDVEKVVFETSDFSHTEYEPPFVATGNRKGSYGSFRCRKGQKVELKCTVHARGEKSSASYKIKCE